MNSKQVNFFLLFLVIAFGVFAIWRYPFLGGYYCSLPVTYGKYDYPLIPTELHSNKYMLTFGIGSRFPLCLCQETLDNIIDKQPQGTIKMHNLDGQERDAPSYLIPQLKIGNLKLKNIIACQSEEREHGTLGKFLGKDLNLLMDFPHSRIIACNTFSKLQSKKLVSKDWVRIPFEIHRGGIVLNVDTDFGTRKLAINTTSTFSLLNSSFISSKQPLASSALILEGQKFGNLLFNAIDLPEGLNEIDGFIGMDFLKEHGIYFDYSHKIAYVEPPRKYFECIPVTFDDHVPTIDVSIQGKIHHFKLDLGSSFYFSLGNEILKNIHKTKYGTCSWYDFRGTQYESPVYFIPEIKIGVDLIFSRVLARQNNEDFYINATLKGSPLQPPGVIGLPILEKYNLLLDFPHSKIYASNDCLSLQNHSLLSQNLLAIPFSSYRDGIILNVETDTGFHRLKLDTGATTTMMRTPHPAFTEKFCIMGHDFGEHSIKVLDMSRQFDWDGAIGMDFIKEHPIFIDYANKTIFIDLQNFELCSEFH